MSLAVGNERNSVPKDGFAGLRESFSSDFISGFIIFLIALPLSVGIALASSAPPTAGILAAIVGGIVGGLLGGSYVTINGPAAGLIVIVLGAVQDLAPGDPVVGFKRMLAAATLAGILQILFGVLRLGALGTSIPGSVIHGMLTAIGVIIAAKQIHVALGVAPAAKDVLGLIAEIPKSIANLNPEVALIAAVGFMIILSYGSFKGKWARFLPAPLIVVLVGVALAKLFDFDHEHLVSSHFLNLTIGPKLLLNLPDNIAKAIILPDFSQVFSFTSVKYAITLALVGSIESLLSAAAVDRLDVYRRTSNMDRELLSKGFCNLTLALIGGLPIIAEIVRSSANVRNGARTRWSNVFHGCFILVFLICFPHLLHMIPLAALAAILVSVGYNLANPKQFLHTAEIGKDHLAAFLTTFLVTLASDLLVGVISGILVELVFNVIRGTKPNQFFKLNVEQMQKPEGVTIAVKSPAVFTNFLALKKHLDSLGASSAVVLDLRQSKVVDHTVLDQLHRYQTERKDSGTAVVLAFSEEHLPVSKHPLAARTLARRRV